MTEADWAALDVAWGPARRAGVLGGADIAEIIAHAAGYLPAAFRVEDEFVGLDLGTGAGVPGVVLAALCPRSSWVLVDANARRCEYAAAAVRALRIVDRVDVLHAPGETVAHDATHRGRYGLVVARAFGPPEDVAEVALPFLAPAGCFVVSIGAQTAPRWATAASELCIELVTRRTASGDHYGEVTLTAPVPAQWPRRPAARRRAPIF